MELLIREVYNALLEAGVSEDKARTVITATQNFDDRMAKIDRLAIELRSYTIVLLVMILILMWKACT